MQEHPEGRQFNKQPGNSSFSFLRQILAIEIYKFFHGLSPSIMKNVLHLNASITYNFGSSSELYCRNPVKYGTDTIFYLPPKIWL